MELIRNIIAHYSEMMRANPWMVALVGMYGMTVLMFFFRSIPAAIWAFVKRQCTTTLYINNTSLGSNMESFNNFLRWFEQSKWKSFSRTLSLNGGWSEHGPNGEDGTVVGIGDGQHFCIYKGRPIWISRKRLENTGASYQLHYEISITMLGRNRGLIEKMIEEFRYRKRENEIGIYVFEKDWKRVGVVRKRDLKTVVVDPEVKSKLISTIDKWLESAQWYYDRGFAYKLTVMLHGIPGSGKTSLIKAFAGHYKRDLCLLHLASMTDTMLRDALMTAPDNSIIALEDFDDVESIHARSGLGTNLYGGNLPDMPTPGKLEEIPGPEISEGIEKKEESGKFSINLSGVTLSGMLQALDGLFSLDNKLVFMTTNRPEIFDAAVVRKGRINLSCSLGALKSPQVHEYIQLMYPEMDYDRTIQFADIAGCDLEDHYKQTLDDPNEFIEIIPKAHPALSLITSEMS